MSYERFLGNINALLRETDTDSSGIAIILTSVNNYSTLLNLLPTMTCVEVSSVIEKKLSEILRDQDHVVRLANDEYGIVLADVVEEDHARLAINKICQVFGKNISINSQKFVMALQFGVTIARKGRPSNANQLVREAYVALSRADKLNQEYSFYDVDFDNSQKIQEQLAVDLYDAVETNQFEAYIQPQVCLQDNVVFSGEILARWNLNSVYVSPETTFPLAEKFGLIKDITSWMLKNSFRISNDLQLNDININLSINISVYDLIDPLFSYKVKQLLDLWQVPPKKISFEITESSMLEENEVVTQNIRHLIELGIKLSIDDFGKGYSSLAYLKELPIQYLKIDQSFITNILHNDKSRAIARAIIELGHALDMRVIAEGVEDIPTFQELKSYGCDAIQGYIISKPINYDDFVVFMKHETEHLKKLG